MGRINYIILFVVMAFGNKSYSQDKLNFNNVKLFPITSVDWRHFVNAELPFLDTIMQHNDILILSDARHGDGSTANARCMLLKALIDSGKINSVYLEGGWLTIEEINDLIRKNGYEAFEKDHEEMNNTVLEQWIRNGFWKYLVEKIQSGKVQLYGFDLEYSEGRVRRLLTESLELSEVKKYMDSIKKTAQDSGRLELQHIMSIPTLTPDGMMLGIFYTDIIFSAGKKFIGIVINTYAALGDTAKVKMWQAILNFLYWGNQINKVLKYNALKVKFGYELSQGKYFKIMSEAHSIRDSLMAERFIDLYTNSKSRKAVIITANYHALKNQYSISNITDYCIQEGTQIMNDILNRKLKSRIYTMAFINSYWDNDYYLSNKMSKLEKIKYPKPRRYSLEQEISKNYNDEYCYIDLQQPELKSKQFYMEPSWFKYLLSNWADNYSGVFYVKTMQRLR